MALRENQLCNSYSIKNFPAHLGQALGTWSISAAEFACDLWQKIHGCRKKALFSLLLPGRLWLKLHPRHHTFHTPYQAAASDALSYNSRRMTLRGGSYIYAQGLLPFGSTFIPLPRCYLFGQGLSYRRLYRGMSLL